MPNKMTSSVSLGCFLFLCLVTQSFSLCVTRDQNPSKCANPSLILVSQSELRQSNGFNLTIKELPSVSTNCSTTNEVSVTMGSEQIWYNFNDNENTVMIKIPGQLNSGLHTIALSLDVSDQKCCDVSATMTHDIKLEIIDNPQIWYKGDNPHTLHCRWNSKFDLNFLIEFILNGNTLGYCGEFTTIPMEHKNGITIQYDNSSGECTIKIDEVTSTTEGDYSCSLMIPYPDNSGFLKLHSGSTDLSPNDDHIYQIVLGSIGAIVFVIIGIITICTIVFCCWKRRGKKDADQPESGDGGSYTPVPQPPQEGQ